MLNSKNIKPIPKYILKLIKKMDKKRCPAQDGIARYYSYLAKLDGELVQIIVACKNRYKNWYCKQVVIHDVHSPHCLVKDIDFYYIAGYVIDWYEEGLIKSPKFYDYGKWFQADSKYFNMYAPIVNKEYALKFPQYKYSAVDIYPSTNIIKYLKYYEQYPHAELLVKFGLSDFATSKQILRKTAKDKNFGKWLIRNSKEISTHIYYVSALLKAYKTGKSLTVVQQIEESKKLFGYKYNYQEIKRLFNTENDVSILFDYLEKHKTNISAYDDYLRACNYLGLDMNEERNKLPRNFQRWHNIRIDEYRTAVALNNQQKRKKLYTDFASVAEKYMPLQQDKDNTYIVIIAKSPADLINEGELLHHCVGRMNYDQRMMREESLIFFVRDKNSPSVPFVTLEYSLKQHTILQCYGERDSRPDQNVLNFVNNKWLPYANKKLKKIA